jgi:GNAT superfamily N-acetyltransferase
MSDLDRHDLDLAVHNAAAFWTALAEARQDVLVRRPGYLQAGAGGRLGMRILILAADPDPQDLAELTATVQAAAVEKPGSVTVEDAYNSVDMSTIGLNPRQLPVMMLRQGAPVRPTTVDVNRVESVDQLAQTERIVVDGFPVERLQPYQRGEAFPPALLARDDVELFLVADAAACLAVVKDGVTGLYWVTTMPEHRSRGVGRGLMHAVLARHHDVPVTLTAARAGRALYESLGFETLTPSTWWS